MNGLYIGDMRCNGLKQPLGVDCKNFTFSWKVKGSGKNIKLIGYELWLSKFPEMEEHIPLICISKESPYPLADVEGFIRNAGRDYLLSGYWKVYHDPDRARELFRAYDRARDCAVRELLQGKGMSEIAVRAA